MPFAQRSSVLKFKVCRISHIIIRCPARRNPFFRFISYSCMHCIISIIRILSRMPLVITSIFHHYSTTIVVVSFAAVSIINISISFVQYPPPPPLAPFELYCIYCTHRCYLWQILRSSLHLPLPLPLACRIQPMPCQAMPCQCNVLI